MLSGAADALAAGGGVLENNIIPPEGRLFLPESWATRATVVMALYNMADNRALLPADVNKGDLPDGTKLGPPQGFYDVPQDSPYYIYVNFCANRGYVSGYPDGTFKPEGFITRAEMCTVLARLLSLKPGGQTDLPPDGQVDLPPDVQPGYWASGAISAIVGSGIMSGYEDKTFRPDNRLTRAELATIITNAKNLPLPRYIREFDDVPPSHWAYKNIACVSAPPIPEVSPFEIEVARLINAERAKAGVGELALDPFLCEIARIKARDMIDNDYFSHASPYWGTPDEMAAAFGFKYRSLGENIAYGAKTPAAVVADWASSPAHNSNIIDKDYNKTGVGCVIREDGVVFWVQEFAG